MSKRKDIDALLRQQSFTDTTRCGDIVYGFAQCMSEVENCIVVVSDLKNDSSRIFPGKFADRLGIAQYTYENSIWEDAILKCMDESEREAKYLAELRFFNYLRHIPMRLRDNYYLATQLKFNSYDGKSVDVLHRMYYRYESNYESVRYAVCVYGPAVGMLRAKSVVIDSVTGETMALTDDADHNILSRRERQILSLIALGMTSQQIADRLFISKHTVSRHRQEIIANLRVRNSAEAIVRAQSINLI